MNNRPYKTHLISFGVMVIIGMLFNPMNILAYRSSDLYLSKTLFFGGLLMASNMIWGHEIIHYLSTPGGGHFNISVFSLGVFLSIGVSTLLREQLSVDDDQWLRRMIPHHSTALTTTHKIYNRTNNPQIKDLAKEIIETQEKEISLMKSMLSK
tara:strand:- start:2 stop:460 length:459 start_codon:yes stop_codon:yes gene_type:complete